MPGGIGHVVSREVAFGERRQQPGIGGLRRLGLQPIDHPSGNLLRLDTGRVLDVDMTVLPGKLQ